MLFVAYLSESGKTLVSMMFSSAASVRVKITRMIVKVENVTSIFIIICTMLITFPSARELETASPLHFNPSLFAQDSSINFLLYFSNCCYFYFLIRIFLFFSVYYFLM